MLLFVVARHTTQQLAVPNKRRTSTRSTFQYFVHTSYLYRILLYNYSYNYRLYTTAVLRIASIDTYYKYIIHYES